MSFQLSMGGSVADASKAVAGNADARFLAGGQSLLPAIRLGLSAPAALVSLASVADLKGIKVADGKVTIGAMTTHAAVAASADVKKAIPALAALAAGIGDRQVRNMGTIGGSLANADPAACYPSAVLGLGATVNTDRRSIPGDQFFTGLYETALQAGEVITSVSFPVAEKAAYVKFKQPASRFAIVGVFVSKGAGGARVAVTGAGASVFRVKALEDKLNASWAAASCDGVSVSAQGLNTDLFGSAEYRAHLIPVLAKRAVASAA
jgi:aerobic carbon-monoxide dehydrogenase medium subunit